MNTQVDFGKITPHIDDTEAALFFLPNCITPYHLTHTRTTHYTTTPPGFSLLLRLSLLSLLLSPSLLSLLSPLSPLRESIIKKVPPARKTIPPSWPSSSSASFVLLFSLRPFHRRGEFHTRGGGSDGGAKKKEREREKEREKEREEREERGIQITLHGQDSQVAENTRAL